MICLHVLLVFEAEVACRLQDWAHLQQVIEARHPNSRRSNDR